MGNQLVAKRTTSRVLCGFLIIAMLVLVACVGPWYRIGFQGLLTDSGGNALTGSHNFVFDYWNGATGTDKWVRRRLFLHGERRPGDGRTL